jgi:HSP20 family protein
MRARWNPFDEMNALMGDMDRLFRTALSTGALPLPGTGTAQGLLPGRSGGGGSTMAAFSPAVEVLRQGQDLVLRAELPGVNPEDVEISVVGNELHLRGERKQNQEVKQGDYVLSETVYGRFERTFILPEGVRPDEVKASYQDGILEIRVPAREAAQARRIPIQGTEKGPGTASAAGTSGAQAQNQEAAKKKSAA